jgi:hypothetical protein
VIRSASIILFAAAALVAPSVAQAAKPAHDLRLYKAERQVSVTAADTLADVSCESGDYALDGMWRVDSVDGGPLSSVGVLEARSDAADAATYRFHFTKSVAGQAQLKVMVTCLGATTAQSDHQHAFTLSARRDASFSGGPGVGAGFHPGANACASGQIAVSPGYTFSSGSGHVVGSRQSLPNESDPARNWAMAFWLDGASTWTTSFRCLTLKSSTTNGHWHKIQPSLIGFPQAPATVGAGEVTELQVHCGETAKGLVGAFDTFPWFAEQDWFLGMDPRIKTRAYKFFNSGASPMLVWTGLTCFKDRTSKGHA